MLTGPQPPSNQHWIVSMGWPLVAAALLWLSTPYDVKTEQAVAAFLVFWIPWFLYRRWKETDRTEFPLLTFVVAMYCLAYGIPLFWSRHDIGLVDGFHHLSDSIISSTMYLGVAGIFCLCCGARVAARIRWSPATRIDIPNNGSQRQYIRIVLVVAFLLRVLVPMTALGSGMRQLLGTIEFVIPSVAFAILFRYYLRKQASDVDKALVLAYLLSSTILGISSGWLGSVVQLGLVSAVVYVYERRTLPITALVAVLPIVLFLQPGKGEFRDRFWREDSTASYSERVSYWVGNSWRLWTDAIDDPSGERTKILADQALARLALLQQTSNVMELTPNSVPYQNGRLYSYLGVTLIPRFLWPNKPSVSDANRWYQVSYKLTLERQLSGVSIAVGTLTEAYINFGWLGPVLVMFPLGILLGLFQRLFLCAESGLLVGCVGAALLPQFLAVESQLAQYIGGVLQQIFLALLVLAPILHVYRRPRPSLGPVSMRVRYAK